MLNKYIIFTLFLFCFVYSSTAQNNTRSIYSSYGLGILQNQEVNGAKGFAGSSLGLKAGFMANTGNPMSLGGRKSTDFDFGFELNNRLQQNQSAQRTDWAGNVNYVSLAFNVWHKNINKTIKVNDSTTFTKVRKIRYNTGFSLSPYTAMDYDYAVEGDSNTFNTLVSVGGNGAISSLQWSNALQLFDTSLTLGFTGQYLFGSINENSLKNLLSDSNAIGYQQSIDQRINGFRLGLGLSKTFTLNAKKVGEDKTIPRLSQTIGILYHFGTNLNSNAIVSTRRVEDFFRVKDTLSISEPNGTINLPANLRIGYGIQKGNLWALSLDYTNSAWSKYRNSLDPGVLGDYSRYSLGFLLNPDRLKNATKDIEWYRKYLWSGGLFYQNGPFSVQNNNISESINEYGISFGVGIPMKSRFSSKVSYFYLSTQYSQRGTINNGLVKEDIFRINLGLNLSDLWFQKRGYN
jgi:hypothetical protein